MTDPVAAVCVNIPDLPGFWGVAFATALGIVLGGAALLGIARALWN